VYCSPRRWVIAVVTPPSAQPAAPAPQSVIGWEPCADYKLATYEQIEDYFRKLAAAVPGRMKLVEMGKTTEGRVQVMGIVSRQGTRHSAGLSDSVSGTVARHP
jgi:hypothetical protein